IDMQGRRTRFPVLTVGERFFSKYEHTTLQRNQRNQYELIGPDGLRLIFGLGPLDQARLREVEEQEAQRELRETEAWQQLLASRAARGEEPLPERTPDARGNLPPQAQTLYLLGMIDPNHNHLRLHYSDDGLPRHLDTSSGRRMGFIFDRTRAEPRLTHVVELLGGADERGHYPREQQQWLVEYRYSSEGDLIEVRDGDGQLGRTFAWRNHMMVEHTEPGGLIARYQWNQLDPKGRVLRSSTALGQFWVFDYDEVAGCTHVTDASGREERFLYDKDKNLIGLVDASGGETRYERDVYGNLITLTDPAGRVTRHQHDARGNLLSVTQPDGARYQLRWHECWRKPVAVTDPLGRTTHYRYDERGNLIAVTEPNGAVTEYRLDGRGLPTTIIDARGGHKRLEHDVQGHLLAYTDCSGNRTQYSYDAQGRLASVTDALGHNTQYGYARINRRDRLNSIRHADGAIERFAYDPLGRLIAHHDPLGRVTRYQLDTEGRPLQRIDPLGHSLRYEYDVHGRLARLHNENNAIYRFAWDALDRLVAEQGFDGRRIDYRYGATGQLLESVDGVPAGSAHLGSGTGALLRTRYQRDAMGRLLDKFSYKPGTDGSPQFAHSRYHYDAAGQLVCARNRQARVELFYNQAGQLAREVLYSRGGQRSELSHAYDLLGNRETTTLPDGRQLNTLTYGSGHVHQINLDFEMICDFERDALHRETGRTQGALYTHFELDPLGRLLRSQASLQRQAANPQVGPGLDTSEPSQGQRIARRFQYDLAGQLLGIDDRRNGTTRYGYDALGRLLSAQAPQASEVFAFDPAHNLMQPEEAQRQEVRLKQTTWSEDEWSAYVQANLDNPDFNPLLT
ncbi:RHS repeat protein, partial [Pseudomonas sp. PDM16]|nr:RHS repeat protein [Pseudomonas sp. PDM16]